MFANASYIPCHARSLKNLKFYVCLQDKLNIKYYLDISHDIQTCLKYCEPRSDSKLDPLRRAMSQERQRVDILIIHSATRHKNFDV